MRKFFPALLLLTFPCSFVSAQNIGIGTNTPNIAALLHVDIKTSKTKGFLISGALDPSATIPDLGAGARLIYYPAKGVFRTGYVDGTQWNNLNAGNWSAALGYNAIASGTASFATGHHTTAAGDYAIAMGFGSSATGHTATAIGFDPSATGDVATAMGNQTTASGTYSTAMGNQTTASGLAATALGFQTVASFNYATSMGYHTTAGGFAATAMGLNTFATGDYSFAAGARVSTNDHTGAFFFGDSDPNNNGVKNIASNDQFAARFNGGYYFISDDAAGDVGVRLLPGGNSWSALSNVRLKENFLAINGESFLNKIAMMKLTTWNYIGQNAQKFRHYGPMAQDFFEAFGKDEYGTIGCDTLINQQDFLGVNLIAIQALEKRTEVLSNENEQLKIRNAELADLVRKMEERLNRLELLSAK